jgi:hypothetical protein
VPPTNADDRSHCIAAQTSYGLFEAGSPLLEASMKWALCAGAAMSLQAASAAAAVVTVPDVTSATATMSPGGRELVVEASITLGGCMDDPRVQAPMSGVQPDAQGVVTLSVVADSSAGPGIACPMFLRPNTPVTPLHWKAPPAGLKSVRVLGLRTPAVAVVKE